MTVLLRRPLLGIVLGGVHRPNGLVDGFSRERCCIYRFDDDESRRCGIVGLGNRHLMMRAVWWHYLATSMAGLARVFYSMYNMQMAWRKMEEATFRA